MGGDSGPKRVVTLSGDVTFSDDGRRSDELEGVEDDDGDDGDEEGPSHISLYKPSTLSTCTSCGHPNTVPAKSIDSTTPTTKMMTRLARDNSRCCDCWHGMATAAAGRHLD